jgi:site-specific DNA-methyltransferase (adenine-specific)
MKNGFARGRSLYPAHYALLYFTKGEPQSFRRPKIPASVCPHCGEQTKDYGGYKRFLNGGVNLSDVWDDLSPLRHRKYKNWPSNELNPEILRRILAIAGRRGGLFVDPFAGSGTSLVLAMRAGMAFVAGDRDSRQFALIRDRISKGE